MCKYTYPTIVYAPCTSFSGEKYRVQHVLFFVHIHVQIIVVKLNTYAPRKLNFTCFGVIQ